MLNWFTFIDEEFITMSIRVLIAALLCGLIGLEREIKSHPAGFRTHLLVGVGSCIMMLLSLFGFRPYLEMYPNIQFDPSRIPSYVISGIGFLGAGTILIKGTIVRGLTTAATIWVVAGIGLLVGVGMYAPAILTTTVVLLSLNLLNRFEKRFTKNNRLHQMEIYIEKDKHLIGEVLNKTQEHSIEVHHISVEEVEIKEYGPSKKYILETKPLKVDQKAFFYEDLIQIKSIIKIK